MTARLALMCNGWVVAKPDTDESYDIVARDPVSGEWATFQCKSIRKRADRNNELVVYARKGNGEPYSQPDADYIVGVLGAEDNDGVTRVFMFENRGIGEYWATEARAEKRWVELPITLDRASYESGEAACPA